MRIIFIVLLQHLVFWERPLPEFNTGYFILIALLILSFVFSFDTDRCIDLEKRIAELERKNK